MNLDRSITSQIEQTPKHLISPDEIRHDNNTADVSINRDIEKELPASATELDPALQPKVAQFNTIQEKDDDDEEEEKKEERD